MYGFRLIVAAADPRVNIISTTDFDVAYLQTENRIDPTTWVLIWYRNPHTGEREYTWIMGCIYGEQPAGHDWKHSLTHKMVVMGGFQEVLNMENMFYHPHWKVCVAVHVDDPIVLSMDEEGFKSVHDFLDDQFDTKGRKRLTVDNPIDYLSMELTLTEDFDILITNQAKCIKLLEDAGKSDIIPTTMPPMTKAGLGAAMKEDELLSEDDNKLRLTDNGRFGWLAQTTHIGLAVATSIAQGLKPIQGTKKVAEQIYAWIQAHKSDGLISRCSDNSGLGISSDADWAGLYAITGEVRSRTGIVITYNGMPILWYSGLQKTTSSQWQDGADAPAIATSTANAETYAASDTLTRALHISYILEEMYLPHERPIQIDIDASAAMGFLNNTGGSGKMKHLDIRESWIQQVRDRDIVTFNKVDGTLIPANFLTKLFERVEFNTEYARLAYLGEAQEPADKCKDASEGKPK